jgi:hypothetical protein
MQLPAPVPILRSFSEDKAHEFYVEFLGFTVEWEHRRRHRCTSGKQAYSNCQKSMPNGTWRPWAFSTR